MGLNEDEVKALTPATLIVITAILTGIGIFDKIAKRRVFQRFAYRACVLRTSRL